MKKKTNYEPKGLVRRFMKRGSSLRSLNGGESSNGSFASSPYRKVPSSEGRKWRPRKNQFEMLDNDDDDSLSVGFLQNGNTASWCIENTLSTAESEPGEYRRGIMFEQKATALKKTPVKKRYIGKNREIMSPIRPPSRDTSTINGPRSSAKNTPQKNREQDLGWGEKNPAKTLDFNSINKADDDPFFVPTKDALGFEIQEGEKSAQKTSDGSDQLPEAAPSLRTVNSDPTDFFSKEQTAKLTVGNLTKRDSLLDTSQAEQDSATDGVRKERKFYQFAVDEDKASTVVESTIQLPANYRSGDYSIDESTAISCDETSQGTRIQQRSVGTSSGQQKIDSDFFSQGKDVIVTSETTSNIRRASSHSRNHANEVKEFDEFFPKDMFEAKTNPEKKNVAKTAMALDAFSATIASTNQASKVDEFDAFFPSGAGSSQTDQGKNSDGFFPSGVDKDGFFPNFGGARETQNVPLPPEKDISSFGGDAYFDSRHSTANSRSSHTQRGRSANRMQASTTSLSYSPSPVNRQSGPVVSKDTGRQPLTLKNSSQQQQQPGSGKKSRVGPRKSNQSNASDNWFASENVREREAGFQLDEYAPRPSSSSKKKKRKSSISSANRLAPPVDPFEVAEKPTAESNRNDDADRGWGANHHPAADDHHRQFPKLRQSNSDDTDSDEDVDNFDDVGPWERPAPTAIGNGVQMPFHNPNRASSAISRARLITRHSGESSLSSSFRPRGPSRNQYIDDGCPDDDARSTSGFSVERVSSRGASAAAAAAAGSSKPLGMPSNAIVASMLFQTQQYDIDKNDVQEKIDALERENCKHKKIRTSQGGIPDAVHTDDDYMTTVSSFSDGTSAYLQDSAWRKPSRDLLNHFTSARALDMDYRRHPVRAASVVEPPHSGLYEA
mmetsp:Transcript_21940/g.52213  ORF Transcript_21940/g.52213 Transcript_21940/m.52213 type:complete len:894 (+) Transcript_21940:80-2761(+)